MDVTIHIDELVVDGREPDRAVAVSHAIGSHLGGALDAPALAAVGRAVAGAASAGAPTRSSGPHGQATGDAGGGQRS